MTRTGNLQKGNWSTDRRSATTIPQTSGQTAIQVRHRSSRHKNVQLTFNLILNLTRERNHCSAPPASSNEPVAIDALGGGKHRGIHGSKDQLQRDNTAEKSNHKSKPSWSKTCGPSSAAKSPDHFMQIRDDITRRFETTRHRLLCNGDHWVQICSTSTIKERRVMFVKFKAECKFQGFELERINTRQQASPNDVIGQSSDFVPCRNQRSPHVAVRAG